MHRSDSAQAAAREILLTHLGISDPSVDALLDLAREALGPARLERCLVAVRNAKPSRGAYALAALGALVAGTRQLGKAWWTSPRPHSERWTRTTPNDWIAEASTVEGLDALWQAIADDSAHALWGASAADVDLNSFAPDDRFTLPGHAQPGDRYVLSFDPGSRVDAIVVERANGLGSTLDSETLRHSPPAEVWWAWATILEPADPPQH